MDRTRRQDMIDGWDANRLKEARVGIVGSGTTAQSLSLYLACLGVDKLYLVDTAKMGKRSLDDFLIREEKKYSPRIDMIKDTLRDIKESPNDCIKVRAYESLPSAVIFHDCDVVVDCTNDRDIKRLSLAGAIQSEKVSRYISCSTGWISCYVHSADTKANAPVFGSGFDLTSQYFIFPENHVLSGIAAAVACDEVRRALMPLYSREEEANRETRHFYYNLMSNPRNRVIEERISPSPESHDILVVGAGGTGTYALLHLALAANNRITIADGDSVSVSNLNRQGLYSIADVGRNKAVAIKDKLLKINPGAQYSIIDSYIEKESQIDISRYDAVLSCVDNAKARKMLSDACVEMKIPLINGGVGPFNGKVELYIPGRSACISCQNDSYISQIGKENMQISNPGCADIGDPSIVVTNALVGCMMAGETLSFLLGNLDMAGKAIDYDSSPGVPYLSMMDSGCIRESCRCSCHGG